MLIDGPDLSFGFTCFKEMLECNFPVATDGPVYLKLNIVCEKLFGE